MHFMFWATLFVFMGNLCGIASAGNLYTIHCASYKTSQQAAVDVKKMAAIGYPAFIMQVEIKEKGKWYRVYAGKYETKEKARLAAEAMVKKKVLSEYSIFPVSADQADHKKGKNIKKEKSLAVKSAAIKAGDNNVRPSKNKQAAVPVIAKNPPPLAMILEKNPGKTKKPEPEPAEKEEAKSGSVLYDKAMGELKEKNYDKALLTFKEFVARDDTSNDLGERALRHMADCHFFLGEKGSKDQMLLAVQFYKNALKSFPDQKRDNALTYFRLAKAYEYLNNYPDALKNYESLISKYPQSAYAPEASYKTGMLLHQIGKYGQAADRLIAYLMKYRGGSFAKQAFYLAADSYYKIQQSASAEVWFRDAQKKWPDFTGIPKEVILDMGQHKFSMRSYDEAIKIFSLYANLYSNDEKLKEALLLLANSYKAANQVTAALNVYNLVIDKYPDTKEAKESILAMASLGVDKPGAKVFLVLGNIKYYKYPLEAYNLLLEKNQSGEIAQIALLQKGDALHKLKDDRRAADSYFEFLKKYPQSKLADEARRSLKLAAGTLIEDSYRKKDYLAVSDIYFKAYRIIPLQADEYEIVNKIADSLSNVGLSDDYIGLLKNYKTVCKDDKIADKIMLRVAEAEMARNKYSEAEKILGELMMKGSIKNTALMATIKQDLAEIANRKKLYDKDVVGFDYSKALNQSSNPDIKSWSLFHIGQTYQKMDNNAEAQKAFTKIKTQAGPEGFWTKVVDYYVSDQQWWNKYGDYLKN